MSFRKALSLAAACLALAASAFAQQPTGTPYAPVSPPQAPESGTKIEVLEFFWYGCPHCYNMESMVASWAKKLPADVVFKRVPAYTNEGWGQGAKMYYTLEAMGKLDDMHGKVFDAIHRDRVNLGAPKVRDEWLAKNGVDPAKYAEVEKSFTVATKLSRAKQMAANYKLDGVPRFTVNGRWFTGPELAGSPDRILATVDQLIVMARGNKAAAAPAGAALAAR
jgi:thiol:disulfide interchange protein DsbA